MAAIIIFEKEEKLAILRIMIEINNYYSSLLPNASKFIQEVANYFEAPNGAYSLTVSEAKDILCDNIKSNKLKTDFVLNILNYMLKDDKITARYTNIEEQFKFSYKEKEKAIGELNNAFRSKWTYAVRSTKRFLNLEFIYQNNNPLEKYSSIKPATTKSVITKRTNIDTIKPTASPRKIENINKVANHNFTKEELHKELDIIRRELKDELHKELINIRKDLIESMKKEIYDELHKSMKNFAHNSFNETLYKDL